MKNLEWAAPAGAERAQVVNPIRSLLEKEFHIPQHPPKPMVNLALGEAKKEEGFGVPDLMKKQYIAAIQSDLYNGYTPSNGLLCAREAIASEHSHEKIAPINPNNVILTAGTSGALYTALSAMCGPGSNILMPKPGFPLCITICQNLGVAVKQYNLLPEQEWEIDLNHLESLIDSKTALILVNNPSNPCGSVFSQAHMLQILNLAEKHALPLLADEVYYGMAYDSSTKFIPFAHAGADLPDTPKVPILSVGALSKVYCVPGWRIGWLIFHDQHNYFEHIHAKALKVCQIWLHPQTPLQAAIPKVMGKVPSSYFEDFHQKLSKASEFVYTKIRSTLGEYLRPVRAKGAMYMMVEINLKKFKDIKNDVEFSQTLVNEQGLLMLPGKCFSMPGFIRIVLCHNVELFEVMLERLGLFCSEHSI